MDQRQNLLRKAISFSERDGPNGAIGRELLDLIGILFTYWHQLRGGRVELSRDQFCELMAPVRRQVEAVLKTFSSTAQRFGLSSSRKAASFNHAERELRGVEWRRLIVRLPPQVD